MACSKFSLCALVIIYPSWSFSTCSYKNNFLWTDILDDGKRMSQPVNLLALPHYCSQANSLTSPVIVLSVPAVKGTRVHRDDYFTSSLPTVSNLPTIYAGSKSTDINSPIPDTCVPRSFLNRFFQLLHWVCSWLH